MHIRPSERKMRYTEEKETKNSLRSQPVTVSIRCDRSTYCSALAICKTASLSTGKSLCTGLFGPGFALSRLAPWASLLRQRLTLRRLIAHIRQILIMEIPLSFAASMLKAISTFWFDSSQQPAIFPTNPHWFFFLKSQPQRPVQPKHALFLQDPASALRTAPRPRSFSWPPVELPDAQGQLPLPFAGYGPNRWHKALHDAKSRLQPRLNAGLQEIFDTFSLGIRTVVSFFHRLNLHSWYAPLLRTTPAPAPVALPAPSGGAGLPFIPCSVIHSNFWDINSETSGNATHILAELCKPAIHLTFCKYLPSLR